MSISKADLVKALADLSPAEKRALMAGISVVPDNVVRMSNVLQGIVDGGPTAIKDVIEVFSEAMTLDEAQAVRKVLETYPDVAAGMTANAARRSKKFHHSVQVAISYLNAKMPQ